VIALHADELSVQGGLGLVLEANLGHASLGAGGYGELGRLAGPRGSDRQRLGLARIARLLVVLAATRGEQDDERDGGDETLPA